MMKIVLILANSTDPDEMQHYAAFYLGLHCLPKYPFIGVSSIQRVKQYIEGPALKCIRELNLSILDYKVLKNVPLLNFNPTEPDFNLLNYYQTVTIYSTEASELT